LIVQTKQGGRDIKDENQKCCNVMCRFASCLTKGNMCISCRSGCNVVPLCSLRIPALFSLSCSSKIVYSMFQNSGIYNFENIFEQPTRPFLFRREFCFPIFKYYNSLNSLPLLCYHVNVGEIATF
jgi:hypothetical protein